MSVLACILAVACSGGASLSGPDETEDGAASVSSVEMTPSDVAVGVDGTADLTLEVRTDDGEQLDRDGQWTVRDTTVAFVKGQGSKRRQVVGRGVGATRVVGTVDGVADSAEVEVRTEASPADAETEVVFDPDRYSSTQELMDDPYGVFGGAEIGGEIQLDTDVAYPGGSQSMRYDWVDQGVNKAVSIGRRIPLPSKAKEVWIEFYVRWSTNFLDIRDFPDDGSTFAHKFLFGEAVASATSPNWETSEGYKVSRWALQMPAGGGLNPPNGPVHHGSPVTTDGSRATEKVSGTNVADYFDGQWHKIQIHWRHDPGLNEIWIDGVLINRITGFTVHPEVDIVAILLGRNKDDGIESGTESLWWGKVSVWTEDPGW